MLLSRDCANSGWLTFQFDSYKDNIERVPLNLYGRWTRWTWRGETFQRKYVKNLLPNTLLARFNWFEYACYGWIRCGSWNFWVLACPLSTRSKQKIRSCSSSNCFWRHWDNRKVHKNWNVSCVAKACRRRKARKNHKKFVRSWFCDFQMIA